MLVPFVTLFTITAVALDGSNFTDIPYLLIAFAGGLLGLPLGRIYLKSYFKKQKRQVESLFSSITKVIKGVDEPNITVEEENANNTEPASSSPNKIKS